MIKLTSRITIMTLRVTYKLSARQCNCVVNRRDHMKLANIDTKVKVPLYTMSDRVEGQITHHNFTQAKSTHCI